MNRTQKIKRNAVGQVLLLLILTLVSASIASAEQLPTSNDVCYEQNKNLDLNDVPPEIWWSEDGVRITSLVVSQTTLLRYSVSFWFRNYKREPVTVIGEHKLIYPDGQSEILEIGYGTVEPGGVRGTMFSCAYITDLYGEYTWAVTLRDDCGTLLDERSVSWIRQRPCYISIA